MQLTIYIYLTCKLVRRSVTGEHRSTADQKWAAEVAKHETLKDALNELQIRLDGKKTRLVAMTEFFRLKPRDDKMLNQQTLSTFFFEVLEVGNQAVIMKRKLLKK